MKKRILLAEDHLETLELTQLELQILGYDVEVARDGAEAVEKAAAVLPTLSFWTSSCPSWMGSKPRR
jgi:CheY-like chemotaxis protein